MSEKTHRRKLVEYFKKNIKKGYTSESLKWALIQQGYSRTDVERAIDLANKEMKESDEKIKKDKEKPKIKYEIYGADNKPIKIRSRDPFFWKNFFRKLKNLFS